jgi:nicotinic acid mononucleotide adenylyltransferase
LKEFEKIYPNFKFSFCLGTDLINGVSKWDYGEKLLEEFEFIICKRINYMPNEIIYPKKYKILEEFVDVSSTGIRDRINDNLLLNKKLNLGINGLTTQSVIKYIVKNNLYSLTNMNIPSSTDNNNDNDNYRDDNNI